ncbi:uncharacterized protein LOC131642615 [Vicia villosa]|uniref:uncharacterized protein LOC131642615 n=1 Tax=Vicia villosa TaxID=3911 RepID=UPI00273AD5FE|nr:uncharacterized protein LOC131642615 [Vicia villosa]
MNLALLSKWKWRILVEDDAVWSGILRSRYGNVKRKILIGDSSVVEKINSIWWRDILLSDNYVFLLNSNFPGAVICELGNGINIPFWYNTWAGGKPLAQAFQELFVLSHDDKITVAEAGFQDAEGWQWSAAAILCDGSAGTTTTSKLSGPPLSSIIVKAVKHLWKVKAPPKVIFFGWRIIHNRLATKDQLIKRGILMDDIVSECVFCSTETESLSHLLGDCLVVEAIWRKVYEWIGPVDELYLEEFEWFLFYFEKVKNLAKRSLVAVIWLATACSIWNRRNGIIFKNDSFSFTEYMSEVVFNSWK